MKHFGNTQFTKGYLIFFCYHNKNHNTDKWLWDVFLAAWILLSHLQTSGKIEKQMQDTDIFMQVIHDLERNRLKSMILSCAVPHWGYYYLSSPLFCIFIQIQSKPTCLHQKQNDKHTQHYTCNKAGHEVFSAEPSVMLWTSLVLIN